MAYRAYFDVDEGTDLEEFEEGLEILEPEMLLDFTTPEPFDQDRSRVHLDEILTHKLWELFEGAFYWNNTFATMPTHTIDSILEFLGERDLAVPLFRFCDLDGLFPYIRPPGLRRWQPLLQLEGPQFHLLKLLKRADIVALQGRLPLIIAATQSQSIDFNTILAERMGLETRHPYVDCSSTSLDANHFEAFVHGVPVVFTEDVLPGLGLKRGLLGGVIVGVEDEEPPEDGVGYERHLYEEQKRMLGTFGQVKSQSYGFNKARVYFKDTSSFHAGFLQEIQKKRDDQQINTGVTIEFQQDFPFRLAFSVTADFAKHITPGAFEMVIVSIDENGRIPMDSLESALGIVCDDMEKVRVLGSEEVFCELALREAEVTK